MLCTGVFASEARAETALLLDTTANKPLDSSKTLFTSLGLTTVSRSDVWSDPSKLNNISAYRITVLYQNGGSGGMDVPDWAATTLNNYVKNGGILIGTGFDEVSGGWGGGVHNNWLSIFKLVAATTSDLMTNTSGWTVRVVAGMENHPIANGPYGAYSGSFTTNAYTDCDGAHPDPTYSTVDVFQIKGWFSGSSGKWYTKISVYRRTDNDGTAIWWNGNGNGNNFVVGEWSNGVMTGAFQNMIYWCMGIAGFDITVNSDAPDPKIGNPSPSVGVNPLPRQSSVTFQVTSPWSYQGVTDEQYRCTGWTGDGTVIPATGTASSVTVTISGDGWITWHWVKEYLIQVTSAQQIGAPATEFNVWQQADTVAQITTTTFVPTSSPDVGWRLSGFIGTGSVPSSGSWGYNDDPTVVFLCDGPGTIEWQWTQQYRLQVLNPRRIGVPTPPPGNNFFDQNDTVTASVQEVVYQASNVRYYCIGFLGTGAVPAAGTNNSVSFILYQPSTITWLWANEYRLDVLNPSGLGDPDPAPGYYWFKQDEVTTCSITSPIEVDGKNYLCVGYYLNGTAHYFENTVNPSVTITMSGPTELKWIVQPSDITLTVISAFGAPEPPAGDHVYTYNDEITLTVESPVPGDEGVRYVCTGFSAEGDNLPAEWAGTGEGEEKDFTYTFRIRTNPTVVTWHWKTQYLLVIGSTLPNVEAVPPLGTWWTDSGTVIRASVPGYIPGWYCDGYTVETGSLEPAGRSYVNFEMVEPVKIVWSWRERTGSPLFPVFGDPQTLTPESPDWGRYCSLALDPLTGHPHLAYYRSYPDGGGSLMYTWYNGMAWTTELVDGRGAEAKAAFAAAYPDVGRYASIALDSNGRPHIAYYDVAGGALRYAHRTVDGDWIIETVDDGSVGEFCSLALNKFNEPRIAYYNRAQGNLMLASLTENGWQIESPESLGNLGSSAKVALDPVTQRPRIVYRDNDNNSLKFAYFNGSEWVILSVDDSGSTGNDVGLVLDSKGMAHIVYQVFLGDKNYLMYAVQSGDNFFRYELEEGPGTGYFPSIALLPGDYPVVAYNDQTAHALRYAWYDGEEWRFYTVDTQGESVGWYTSLAVLEDKVAVAYWTTGGLRYVTLDHKSETSTSAETSTGGGGGGGGCFIATAAFGGYCESTVLALTEARDSALCASDPGRALVSLYYAVSPDVAERLSGPDSAFLRRVLKLLAR